MFTTETFGRVALIFLLSIGAAAGAELPSEEARSREHYRLGSEYYAQSRYDEALHEFEIGRSLSNRPAFLFNIARCYEKLADWSVAIKTYEAYLPSAEPEERTELLRLIAQLRKRLPREETAETPETIDLAEAAPRPRRIPVYRRPWLWATVAGVVASAVAVGVGLGLEMKPSLPTLTPLRFQ